MSGDKYMQRAIFLAQKGLGSVAPNPLVGCVIVHNDTIIGEGFHHAYGEPHAEVNAIRAVENKKILSEATCYISLEPCSHHGKTPPCADLLIESGIRNVVISTLDPNPLVAGQGLQKLKDHGVKCDVGRLESLSRWVNRRFFTSFNLKRPYVILKWAQSNDRFIAPSEQNEKEITWISNRVSQVLVHQWRAEEQAILVGSNTVNKDDPSLTTRHVAGKSPIRVLLDVNLDSDTSSTVFDGSVETLIYSKEQGNRPNAHVVPIGKSNFIESVLDDLYKRGVQSILVEGGKQTLESFIDAQLWDEARVFTSPTSIGSGLQAPTIKGRETCLEEFEGDELIIMVPND